MMGPEDFVQMFREFQAMVLAYRDMSRASIGQSFTDRTASEALSPRSADNSKELTSFLLMGKSD